MRFVDGLFVVFMAVSLAALLFVFYNLGRDEGYSQAVLDQEMGDEVSILRDELNGLKQDLNSDTKELVSVNVSDEPVNVYFILKRCDLVNSTLKDKMLCVKGEINKVYKYRVTSDEINLTFKELVSVGGDCKNWGELWVRIAEGMGFNAELVKIKIWLNHYHAYARVYNDEGFCIASNNLVKCFMYGGK